ncbi:MAG: hypothetical protein AB1540_02885 [Bdellovibrionota bacterium]
MGLLPSNEKQGSQVTTTATSSAVASTPAREFAGRQSDRGMMKSCAAALRCDSVEIMEGKLASKQDLVELETRIDSRFFQLESKLESSVAQIESKLTVRMGIMLAASIAILTAIQKLV